MSEDGKSNHAQSGGEPGSSLRGAEGTISSTIARSIYLSNVFRSITRLTGVLAGIFLCYLGYDLFLRGVTGAFDFKGDVAGFRGQLLSASPGLLFCLLGVVVIIVSVHSTKSSYPWHITENTSGFPSSHKYKAFFTEGPRGR